MPLDASRPLSDDEVFGAPAPPAAPGPARAMSDDEVFGASDHRLPEEKNLPRAAAETPEEEPGFLSTSGQALLRGVVESGKAAKQLPSAFSEAPPPAPDTSPVGKILATPVSEGWSSPTWWAAHILHGAGSSAPGLALGAVGALGAQAAFPEAPGVAGLAGGAAGFGLGSMATELAPAYQRARQDGLDHDAAVTRAMEQTGIAGAFGAAMGLAPGLSVFGKTAEGALKRPISEALAQIFVAQPGLGATQQMASGAVAGQLPTPGELATGYSENAGMGAAITGAHAVLRSVRPPPGAETPAAAETAPAAPPRIRTPQEIEDQDGVGPDIAATIHAAEVETAAQHAGTTGTAAPPPTTAAPPPAPEPPAPSTRPGVSPAWTPPETDHVVAPSPTPAPPAAPSPFAMLRPADLTLDPATFQFKAADETGNTGALAGTSKWEPNLANPITAWQSNDGRTVVVNGHQRTLLAQRAEAAGQPDVQIPARIFREQDGFTPEYMRTLGAYQNLAEGSGTAIDAAKVMRGLDTMPANMTLPELPPKQAIVQQGRALAKLSPEAFGVVENSIVPPAFAAEVGARIADPTEQLGALQVLARAQPANAEQARIIVQDVINSGFHRGVQSGLFGDEAFAQSLIPERARVLDNAIRSLRRSKGFFKAAVEGEETLAAAGNTLNAAGNIKGTSDNARLLDTLQRDATTRGPLSDALTSAARDLAAGKSVAKVSADFLSRARKIVESGPGESLQPRAPAGGAGLEGEAGPIEDANQAPMFGRKPPLPPAGGAPLFGEAPRPAEPKREAEPTIRTDARQVDMFGRADAAVQAQAARDQAGRGALTGKGEQRAADEGLFAPAKPPQGTMFGRGDNAPPERPEAVRDALNTAIKMTGGRVKVEAYDRDHDAFRIKFPDGKTEQVFGYALGRLIRAAIEPGLTMRNMSHESLHALRNLGVFTKAEWATMERAAEREDWAGRFKIDERYPGASADQRMEEAIAERFAHEMTREKPAPGTLIGRMVVKLQQFIARLRNALAGMGYHTAEDIFGRVESGEVGARQPGSGMEQKGPRTIPASEQMLRAWQGATDQPAFVRGTAEERERPERVAQQMDLGLPRNRMNLAQKAVDEVRQAFSPTARAQAKPMEHIIRKSAAELNQSRVQSVEALQTFGNAVGRLSPEEQLAITDRRERGEAQPTPELNRVIEALREQQAKIVSMIRSLGPQYLNELREHYMGHIWANHPEWRAGIEAEEQDDAAGRARASVASKSPLKGSGNFLKRRTFDTQRQGMDAGLIPITTNPIEMQLIKIHEAQKFYHGIKLADDIKSSRIARWVRINEEGAARQEGLVKLNDQAFQPRVTEEGEAGRKEFGNWYAPEGPAQVFNNYVSKGLAGHSTIYDAIRGAGNALNSAQLSFSGFHATFIAFDTMMSRMALGMQQLARGEAVRGIGNIISGASPHNIVSTVLKGAALREAYLHPAQATPEMRKLVQALIAGGGRIKMDPFYQSNASGSFVKSMGDLAHPSGMLHDAWQMAKDSPLSAPFKLVGRLVDTLNHPLMGVMVPRAKLGVFSDMAADFMRRNPEATPEETAHAMTKAWDSVDNRMGQLVYDNLFWNKTMKDVAFITTRSVGWNLGSFREIGGGLVDTAKAAANLARMRPAEFTARMGYTMAMPAVTAIYGAMFTYLMTGKGPQSLLDYFYPPTMTQEQADKENGGVQARTTMPGYIKDVVAMKNDPFGTVGNKTQPLIATAIELKNNRDYYGGIINAPTDNPLVSYPEYLLNQAIPFSWRGWMKSRDEGATGITQALNFWGIQPAPQSIVNPGRGEAFQRRADMKALRMRAKETTKGRISITP